MLKDTYQVICICRTNQNGRTVALSKTALYFGKQKSWNVQKLLNLISQKKCLLWIGHSAHKFFCCFELLMV